MNLKKISVILVILILIVIVSLIFVSYKTPVHFIKDNNFENNSLDINNQNQLENPFDNPLEDHNNPIEEPCTKNCQIQPDFNSGSTPFSEEYCGDGYCSEEESNSGNCDSDCQ
jgi:hypothetical protein